MTTIQNAQAHQESGLAELLSAKRTMESLKRLWQVRQQRFRRLRLFFAAFFMREATSSTCTKKFRNPRQSQVAPGQHNCSR